VGPEFTAATFLGWLGAAFMFSLALHAAGRTGFLGAGAFATWSAVAGLRLLADVSVPVLPEPWSSAAGVIGNLTTWIAALVLLLFALRFTEEPRGIERWRAGPFWVACGVASAAVLTNPLHEWYLRSPWSAMFIEFGPLGWLMVVIGNVIVLSVIALLAVATFRSEHRRVPLALTIVGVFVNLASTVLPLFAWSPFGFGHVDVALRAASAGLFALALFGFGLLRLVPVGREAVLRQMDEGWLVLDPAGRIADLNPAAERLFGVAARWAVGRQASDALRGVVGLDAVWQGEAADSRATDVRMTAVGPERELDVHVTPLLSRRDAPLGRTLLVRDVTSLRRAEAQALDRERALAALRERERVARELHDGLAQVLGFVRLQAQAARGLLRRDAPTAEAYLSRLAETALVAHGEVRSFIAGSASASDAGWLAAIAGTVRRLREETGLDVEFLVPPGVEDGALAQPVGAHVVRIVQEALHNVRKHAGASRVSVVVEADDASLSVVVTDDGTGMAEPTPPPAGTGFGLRFMHERAEAAGGTLVLASGPAGGTQVTLRVPRRGMPALPAAAAEAGHGVG